jgi:hypothetical protein
MKGISQWIWIVGSIISAVIIFTIVFNQMLLSNRTVIEQRSINQFDEIVSNLKNMCWESVGRKAELTVNLGDMVEGIYAAESAHTEYEKEQLINNIILNKNSTGKYLCLKIEDKRLDCKQFDCNVTFPFIGYVPEKFSLSALINSLVGKGKIYTYLLTLWRVPSGIDAYLVEHAPTTTTVATTTTISGSTTTSQSTTTTMSSSCNLDEMMGMVNKDNVYSYESNIASQPHPAEGWGADTSWNKATRDWIKGQLEGFGLSNVRIETFTYSGATGYSVIGEVGTGSNEIVIGGHRDSVPQGPGAIDNTGGASTVMEMARVFASKCKDYLTSKGYKLIFVLFDSEELGIYGSKAYVNSHSTASVKYMMNFDCPSGYNKDNSMYIWITDNTLSGLVDQCCSSYSLQCEKTFNDPCGYACSDYAPFQSKGIPFIFPMDKSSGGLCAAGVIHTSGDNLSVVDKDKLVWASKLGTCVLRKLLG